MAYVKEYYRNLKSMQNFDQKKKNQCKFRYIVFGATNLDI